MKIGLLDNETVPNAPTSKFLTKEEIQNYIDELIMSQF